MKELYGWYGEHPGAWNNYDTNNEFSVQDFLAWIIFAEIGYTLHDETTVDYAKDLAAQKMMWLCGQFSAAGQCNSINNNAVFNYIGTRASAAMRYDAVFGSNPREPDPSYNNWGANISFLTVAHDIAGYAMSYTGKGSLADWGNASLFTDPNTINDLYAASGGESRNQYLVTFGGADPLYFFSAIQNTYWHCRNKGGISC